MVRNAGGTARTRLPELGTRLRDGATERWIELPWNTATTTKKKTWRRLTIRKRTDAHHSVARALAAIADKRGKSATAAAAGLRFAVVKMIAAAVVESKVEVQA